LCTRTRTHAVSCHERSLPVGHTTNSSAISICECSTFVYKKPSYRPSQLACRSSASRETKAKPLRPWYPGPQPRDIESLKEPEECHTRHPRKTQLRWIRPRAPEVSTEKALLNSTNKHTVRLRPIDTRLQVPPPPGHLNHPSTSGLTKMPVFASIIPPFLELKCTCVTPQHDLAFGPPPTKA